MKKQLLLMLSLSGVAYNFGMDNFAQRLLARDEASALEMVRKVEKSQIELTDFTLEDVATTAEVAHEGITMPFTFACVEQERWGLLEGLLSHVEKPSAVKSKKGYSLAMRLFAANRPLFYKLAALDSNCLMATDELNVFPLYVASVSAAINDVRSILNLARDKGILKEVLDQRVPKLPVNLLDILNFMENNPQYGIAAQYPAYLRHGENGNVIIGIPLLGEKFEAQNEIKRLIMQAHAEVEGLD